MNENLAVTSERTLPSGRSVILRVGDSEELQVRSPDGEVELTVVLTEAGPVVRLRAARLEMETAESVDVRCKNFNVRADEVRVKTDGDIHLNGAVIRLNC
ncbi:MAG: hypothetical protein U0797_00090 [Gemmataceae bacterium]